MTKGINVRNSNIRLNNPTDNEKEKYQNSPVSITRNGDVGLNPKFSLFSSLDALVSIPRNEDMGLNPKLSLFSSLDAPVSFPRNEGVGLNPKLSLFSSFDAPVSIPRNGDVGLNPKLSLFSSLDGINDATIGLKVTKENFPNKLLLVKLNTDSVRKTFGLLE